MDNSEPISVLVLAGGPDAEHSVSLDSAAAIASALQQERIGSVHKVVIDRPDPADLRKLITKHAADVVFPALHGPFGEGGPLQERLEAIGVAYVGATPDVAKLAMDKMQTKTLVAAAGVPTPEAAVIATGDECPIEPPLVLKPVDDGSSVDLRIVRRSTELATARVDLHRRHARLLAERFVPGRELTVGLLDGETLPIIEIVPNAPFYDYDAKYTRSDTVYHVDPLDIEPAVAERCRTIATTAWRTMGIRDLARVDLILEGDIPWFLELNTMPGFTSHSLLPMAARAIGIEMPALCGRLVRLAASRRAVRPASTSGV